MAANHVAFARRAFPSAFVFAHRDHGPGGGRESVIVECGDSLRHEIQVLRRQNDSYVAERKTSVAKAMKPAAIVGEVGFAGVKGGHEMDSGTVHTSIRSGIEDDIAVDANDVASVVEQSL